MICMYARYFLKNYALDMATGLENIYGKGPIKFHRTESFYILSLELVGSNDDACV